MARVEELTLDGCTPTPLASYLKALGVHRLISSDANNITGRAADANARGWWENERFHMETTLDQAALVAFFLNTYAPSPIVAPWNGRAGFLEGDAGPDSSRTGAELMNAIQRSESPRLKNIRRSIESLRGNQGLSAYDNLRARKKQLEKELESLAGVAEAQAKEELARAKRAVREAKRSLLPTLRATTDNEHLVYVDTCYALADDDAASPLLGSGGVDGSRDFGVNFAERLSDIFDLDSGVPTDRADQLLNTALFGVRERMPSSGTMGQFNPGQGGPNATTGFEGNGALNAWDVVLAMEGSMVFAGAVTRRWGAASMARAAFPFTFEHVAAGAGSMSPADPNHPRGEVWTPLWSRPATHHEVRAVFSEGRLTLGQQRVATALDAARSVARLGHHRGIGSFERYALVQPDAKVPYQATPVGRFNAPDRPRPDLIEDLDAGGWLQSARRLVRGKAAPASAKSTMRQLEDALFQMTDSKTARHGIHAALIALGNLVAWMATSPKAREMLRPPPPLSSAWVRNADDASPEYRVAAALAGLGVPKGANGDAMPMACHFAPIDEDQLVRSSRHVWSESKTPSVVWGTRNLTQNLVAVLERRLVDAAIRGLLEKPLVAETCARSNDVGAFLTSRFDDVRCGGLLSGLIWARPAHLPNTPTARHDPLPFAYSVLKPFFTPDQRLHRFGAIAETVRLPIPTGLISRLRTSGRSDGRATDAAIRLVLAKARMHGMSAAFDPAQTGGRQADSLGGTLGVGIPSDRLAASLLIPVDDSVVKNALDRAYPGTLEMNDELEDTTDGT